MPDQISESTTIKLKIAAMLTLAGVIWMGGAWAKGYLLTQEYTSRETAKILASLSAVMETQSAEIKEIKAEILAMRQQEARLIDVQTRITANNASLASLDASLTKYVQNRWNIDMMQVYVARLGAKLEEAGIKIEIPDIQAIRAKVLFAE